MRARVLSLFACALAVPACGGESGGDDNTPEPEVRVVEGAPAAATIQSMSSLEAGATVTALGASSTGRVLLVAGSHTYEVNGESLDPRTLYAGAGEPESTGQVFAVVPRMQGGAWMAAENGLFIIDTLYVLKSPVEPGMGSIRAATQLPSGALSGLWLGADAGLFRDREPRFEKYPLAVLDKEQIDGVAVAADGDRALVISDGQLALLEVDGSDIISDRPPLEAGRVHAVAAGTARLYAAAEKGLLRYDASEKPHWTRFTLSTGGDAQEVLGVTVDQATDTVYARTQSLLVRLSGDELTSFSVFELAPASAPLMAVDSLGDVWMGHDGNVDRVTPGMIAERVTYANDVLPWIMEHCSMCHRNQTQNFEDYVVFSGLADMALLRVRAGDMPRCVGGVPCAESRLDPSEYTVLESWIRDGKPE